jgi:ribosomal protein S18 acetylase RimI-like enzyme
MSDNNLVRTFYHGGAECAESNGLAPQIGVCSTEDRAEALGLVFSRLRRAERRRQVGEALAQAALPEGAPFAGLIAARRDGHLVGAVFCQIEPGQTAIIWLPRLIVGEPQSTAAALLAATWEFLARHPVVLAQVLLPTVDKNERTILRAGGLRHLTNLLYLVSLEGSFPTAMPTTLLDFESYGEANRHRWLQVLTATYEGTLDCAGLGIVRDPEDILAGYRAAGAFDPRHWLLVRSEDRDVGCLLLADHPRHDSMEVLYLGLIPAARGHGWGKQLARRGQWLARLAGRRRLLLAVDAANRPATETYTAVGFQTWQRRQLYVKELRSTNHWHASFQQVFHAGASAGGANSGASPAPS